MLKCKKIFIVCFLLFSILASTNSLAVSAGSSENSSLDISTLPAIDTSSGPSENFSLNSTTSAAIEIKNKISFTVEKKLSAKFNLGDKANAYIIGNKLIILSKDTIEHLTLEARKYKEVPYKYMYILDIKKEEAKLITTVSAITIPKKSTINVKDNFLFVNKDNPLPENYSVNQKQLVDLKKTYKYKCSASNGTSKVRIDYAEALNKMFLAASKQGITKFVCNSGYRSLAYQAELFNARLKSNLKIYKNKATAIEKTRLRVVYAGTSEHNAGIALDILQYPSSNADTFKYTKEAKWLKENCYKYGFIVRYPEGKTKLTYTMYEPWHIRYVGLPYSKLFQSSGLCFEEIVKKLRTDKYLTFNDDKDKYILFYSKTADLYCTNTTNIQRSILTYKNEYVTLIKL
ncbi:MAG: M15 family metallopeptidase [Ruminiclostridium sp.]